MKAFCTLAALLTLLCWSAFGQPDARQKWEHARELVTSGRAAEAVPIYEELLAASPDNTTLAMNLVVARFQAGQYKETIAICEQLVESRKEWAPPWLFLGASYFQSGRLAEATEPLRTVLRLQPDERNARLMLAEALLQTGQSAEAAEHFEMLKEPLATEPRVWYGLERSYQELEAEVLEEIERQARGSAEWHALAGRQEFEVARYGRAIRHYRDVLELDPDFPGIHAAVAEVYRAAGKDEWAEAEEARAGEVDCAQHRLACAFADGRYQEVLSESASGGVKEAYWRARALQELGQEAFDRLSRLPESAQLHELKARRLDEHLRHLEAAGEWRKALALSPGNRVLEQGLAVALFKGRELQGAAEAFAALVETAPETADIQLVYGRTLLDMQKPEEAVPHLEKAVELDAANPTAHGALGEALVRTGQGERAVPHLQAALGNDEDGSWHFQLAQAYRAAGDPDAARDALEGFRKLRKAAEEERLEQQKEYPIPPPE